MHADLSRVTFRPGRHYSAVLAQQGRVQLDADANEQADIHLHLARTTAADLIGPHGGPAGATGFGIAYVPGTREPDDLRIGGGRYYVDGILCDADRPAPGTPAGQPVGDAAAPADTWTYWQQPDAWLDPEHAPDRLPEAFPYLVHLAVWERAVTAAEDPALREAALGAALPDTAARRRVVWQVRALPGDALDVGRGGADEVEAAFQRWVRERTGPAARLAVRAEQPRDTAGHPCATSPDSRYRGAENQLYRVEVHRGGTADGTATFKWSRENGSVALPVTGFDGTWAELAALGGDDRLDVAPGDRVEVVDSAYTDRREPADLPRVEEVDVPGRRVRLSREPEGGTGSLPERHPLLRRWDHRTSGRAAAADQGALKIKEGEWTDLEDGVQVWFEPGGAYRPGDWWAFPARTATGGVEWPHDADRGPLLLPPAGIEVHYAPLAWVQGERAVLDLRRAFGPLAARVPTAD